MRQLLSLWLIITFFSNQLWGQSDQASNWVESTYESMSDEERIGQLFIFPFEDESSAQFLMDHFHVGGFILPETEPSKLLASIKFLQDYSKLPLFIAIKKSTQQSFFLPHFGTIASISDHQLVHDLGRNTGLILKNCGANIHLMDNTNLAFESGLESTGLSAVASKDKIYRKTDEGNEPDAKSIQFTSFSIGLDELNLDQLESDFDQGSNFIVFSGSVDIPKIDDLRFAMKKNFKKKQLRALVKQNLILKSKLRSQKAGIRYQNIDDTLFPTEDLTYKIALGAIVINNTPNFALPITTTSRHQIATLTNNDSVGKLLRKGVDRYVGANHIPIEQITLMADAIMTTLSAYQWVIIDISQDNIPSQFIQNLIAHNPNIKIVCYDNGSTVATRLPEVVHIIWHQEPKALALDLISQVLFGAVPATGVWPPGFPYQSTQFTSSVQRLRYTHPKLEGMNDQTLAKIDSIVMDGIAKKAMPGAQILIAKNGAVVYEKSFGHYTYANVSPVQPQSLYDIASLTKVVGTLQAIMYLVDRNRLNLNDKIDQYLPDLVNNPKGRLVVKDILAHQAGLPSYYPFWANTLDKQKNLSDEYYSNDVDDTFKLSVTDGLYSVASMEDSLWNWIKSDKVRLRPSGRYLYSDIGFMILKRLSETILQKPLDKFLDEEFYGPLGMHHTTYRPLNWFNTDYIVPTEEDKFYRHKTVVGYVHDQNAAMIGGVAGHAGLFSNANDIAKIMQMQLWDGKYGGKQYYRSNMVESFSNKAFKNNRRGLGWDKPTLSSRYDNTSSFCSEETFGHTGFTGTAVWADPKENLLYVFLSNRTFPDSRINKLNELNIRNAIQDVIYQSIQTKSD